MTTKLASTANRVVYFHLKNQSAARNVVKHLIKSPNDSIILPFTDYPGPLTREILSKSFRSLTVCERDPDVRLKFQTFCNLKYPDKHINIHPDDLFDLSFKTYSDAAQKRCTQIVKQSLDSHTNIGYQSMSGSDDEICDNHVKFLVPLLKSRNETGFMRNLYYQISLRMGLCTNTLLEYYFLLSERQYKYLDAKPSQNMRLYRSSSVLFNTVFNIKQLETLNLADCFSITVRKLQKTVANNNASYENVHLVRFEPNLDVLNTLSPRALLEYRFLITQMMHRRRVLVVDYLNNYFDRYLDDIAPIGITDRTRSGDLDKDQYYKLFLYLRTREDYKNSTFLQAAANAEENILITS